MIASRRRAGRGSPRAFEGKPIGGKAVLVHTGWDAHWRTERYLSGHPFLTADAAEYLVEAGVVLVGIDSLNIDDIGDLARPVHSTLLGAGIPIVEHCAISPAFRVAASASSRSRRRSPASAAGRCGLSHTDVSFRSTTTVSGFPAVALRSAELEVVAVPASG